MSIVVCDANIIIDLLQADLFPAFINLGYKNHAPPGVIDEVIEDRSQILIDAIETGQLIVPIIEDLNVIFTLKNNYPSLSFHDCSCLYLAQELNSILLTGEKPLRKIAQNEFNLEVHGTLYIFDELLRVGLMTHRMAHEKLKRLISNGTYLPPAECNTRLKRWKRKL